MYTRITKKPIAMNQVIPDPSRRPRTPKAAPLDTWLLVPVFGLIGVTARKTSDPAREPTVIAENAAHQPRPKAMASAPKIMLP